MKNGECSIARHNRDLSVMFGIATSGVVLSTLLEGSDADYRLVVIEDRCADLDMELHSALIKRLFPARANVMSAENFVRTLENSS